jgi:AcrR family transcriptional regulator
VERTAEIFNKKGYAGTSVSDLVEATGLTKGSIYGNFENKEEVALAAFDYNCTWISNTTRDLIERQTTYHGKLMVYADVYKKMLLGKMSRGGCPILNTAVEADDTNPALKQRAAMAIDRWENKVVFLIQQGIECGEFAPGVNARKLALTMIALIEGGMMISKVTGNRESFELVLDSVELLISAMEEGKTI